MGDKKTETAPRKVVASVRLTPDLLEQAKRAAFWTPGLTLGGLIEESLRRELARLEKGRGSPFPKRTGQLRSGRPLKG